MTNEELKAIIKAKEIELDVLKQEYAELICPFRVGDVVTDGKRTERVTRILYRSGPYFLSLTIKKDGSDGAVPHNHGQWEFKNWRKVE